MSKTIGIDLGTTNSCAAVAEGYEAKVLPNLQGYRTTPSILARNPSGKLIVGHLAKRQAVTNPLHTVHAVKRLIGRRYESPEVEKARKNCSYKIVRGPNDDVRVEMGGQVFSPQEVSALILAEIKRFASEAVGEEVTKAIITVPAYFNDNQRQATKDAGRIAGLDVLRVINEPTAACIAYGLGKSRNAPTETVVVYDFGGGTFDVSVIRIQKSVFEVLATGGDTYLGGEDFDGALVEHLVDYGKQKYKVDLGANPLALQRLRLAAEDIKKNLSFQPTEQVILPFLAAGADGKPINFEATVNRAMLEKLTTTFVDHSIEITQKTLSSIGLDPKSVDAILLVGGQTRMPLIQQKVGDYFGKAPRKGVNPDEVVAMGAAIEAAVLENPNSDVLLLDVTPLDLGIATQGDSFTTIIPRNSRVPLKKSHIFTTVQDNQTSVKLQVYQGDNDRASQNEFLGEFTLTGIRPATRAVPRIEVMFSISSDGMVAVSAKDLDTGTTQKIEVSSSNQLSDQEISSLSERTKSTALEWVREA